jgi:hypothetical protein
MLGFILFAIAMFAMGLVVVVVLRESAPGWTAAAASNDGWTGWDESRLIRRRWFNQVETDAGWVRIRKNNLGCDIRVNARKMRAGATVYDRGDGRWGSLRTFADATREQRNDVVLRG